MPVRLGKYELVRELGAGAMGVVYLAYDAAIDRQVAVKTIRREALSDTSASQAIARFRQEAIAAGRLTHPGIVAVYDYGEDDSVAYIVMEYAPGVDLGHYVADRRLSLPEVGGIMAQLLDALQYAHDAGVVHRDIKPRNILVSGRVKISDFGVARVARSQLTQSGVAIGTPAYMAPEQYRGSGVDHRVDLFASGVLLYELLTGELPFVGEFIEEIAYKICHTQPPLATRIRTDLPRTIDDVLAKALAKNKEVRFASARDLARAIDAVVAGRDPGIEVPSGGHSLETMPTAEATAPPTTRDPPSSRESRVTPEAMARITQTLAKYVGPIAQVMVKKAGFEAKTYRELCVGVSTRLADEERVRFLSEMGVSASP
jgi:serine/threonine-protein kinase